MPVLDVYSRQGCHLCEVLIEQLVELAKDRATVVVHDIDGHPEWRSKYDVRVPVVELDRQIVCEYRLDRDAVNRALAQLADSE